MCVFSIFEKDEPEPHGYDSLEIYIAVPTESVTADAIQSFYGKRFVELNQSIPCHAMPCHSVPYQIRLNLTIPFASSIAVTFYYSSVWFNSVCMCVCLPCFCFWHWCQKQIISHHARIATQAHQTLFQNVACQIYLNPYHWKLLFRFLFALVLPMHAISYVHVVCVCVCILYTHSIMPLTASKCILRSGFTENVVSCLLCCFTFRHLNYQIVQANWTMKADFYECNSVNREFLPFVFDFSKRHRNGIEYNTLAHIDDSYVCRDFPFLNSSNGE